MSTPVAQLPKRLAGLFLLALLGILLMFGVVVARLAGPTPTAGYAVLVLVLGVLATRSAKHRMRLLARAQGRTCTCCTTSVHDPVKVI